MYSVRLLIISALLFNLLIGKYDGREVFNSPLKIPLAISANFGELRIDHFHSGVDLKTQGVTGKEVIAAASGYVYRISVSPGGFGKAIYLKHQSGYSTVYGHLDKFIPEIDKYVTSMQYEEKSYMITLWPPKDRFRFNKGDVIAYSGNSGSSSGPHLHYEIRKSDAEIPVNPMLFNFGIEDKIKPVIEKLAVYPLGRNSLINNQHKILKTNVTGGNGKYYIPSVITVCGETGFGLKSYDLSANSFNRSSVYSISLAIDSIPVYNYRMDQFSFDESRYVNSHIDYATFVKEDNLFERVFLLPNDRLSTYHGVVKRGIIDLADDKKHRCEITLADVNGNKSSLVFYLKSVKAVQQTPVIADGNGYVMMPYNRNNKFVAGGVTLNIPSGSLYDTLFFEYKRVKGSLSMFSDIHQLHNIYTPVHKPMNISVKPNRIPYGKGSKLLIVQLSENGQKIPVGGTLANGYITANTNSFGNFYIGIDTVPPKILSNGLKNGTDLSGQTEIKIKISDEFSGIKSYEPSIDNKWALFEYDQKNNSLIYRFDPDRITKNSQHHLSLTVSDNRENVSNFDIDFKW